VNATTRALFLCVSATALGLPLAASAQTAATMTRDQYESAKDAVDARYKAAKQKCDAMSGNPHEVCEEEAQGQHNIDKAELDYKRSGKPEDARKVQEARAEATYEVAKERCDDKTGNTKDVCVADAKAAHAKALADIKSTGTTH